jgi:SprT protein
MERFPLGRRPELLWKGLRVSAGIAYYRINRIGLSRHLLTDEDRLRSTLVHEYAHLLAFERHGQKSVGHGPLWKQAMHDLGAKPERTHCYEVERNTARQVVTYQCRKCGASILRNRRLPRRRKYVHANCGGGLRLVGVDEVRGRG